MLLHTPSLNVTRDVSLSTCVAVVTAAQAAGHDAIEAGAQAGIESRWNPGVTDGKNSHGPLQANPAYFCPGGRLDGCDLIAAGIRARESWELAAKGRYGRKTTRADVLCMYWRGYNYTGGGCSYSHGVLGLARKAKRGLQ